MGKPTPADKANEQAAANGTFESELAAKQLTAEEARQKAIKDDADNGLKHGMPKDEFNKLPLGEQLRTQMNDVNSDLRNRTTKKHEVDFQLLNSTNAFTISAMTGQSLDDLAKRAEEIGVTLKGSAAGDFKPN